MSEECCYSRCFNEGMRALSTYTAMCIDKTIWIGLLLTPVVKAYVLKKEWKVFQIVYKLGGAGYTKDWMIEQLMRDGRITMIYEGTNGIQALIWLDENYLKITVKL